MLFGSRRVTLRALWWLVRRSRGGAPPGNGAARTPVPDLAVLADVGTAGARAPSSEARTRCPGAGRRAGVDSIVMAASITPPPGFDELPIEEKIAYVQALWDLIAQEPSDIPVPAWHEAVIAQRLAEARSSSASVRPWSEVRSEVRARLHSARK